ncbi:MAG: LolA family protein [Pirellulales bacterium]
MNDRTTSDEARLLRQLSQIEPLPEVVRRAVERTRAALTRSQSRAKDMPPETRGRGKARLLQVAAAIAAVLLVAVGGAYFLFVATLGPTSAFAQVQAAIEQVPCVAFSAEVIQSPKGVSAKSGTQAIDLAGNRSRFEAADGEVFVVDHARGMWMHLDPVHKQAFVLRNQPLQHMPSFGDFLKSLRDCDAGSVERLQDGNIDGQTVERYRIPPEAPIAAGAEMLVSVDPRTHLPVRIDLTVTTAGGGPLHIVCKAFSFDQRDPSLFAMVPPAGYQVDSSSVPESQVVPETKVDLGRPKVSIEIRLTEKAPAEGLIEAAMPGSPAEKLYLHPEPIITQEHIQSCRVSESGRAIELTFTDAGSARMTEATSGNVPKVLAVLVEGKVVCAPRAHSTISRKAELVGRFSPDLIRRLSGK